MGQPAHSKSWWESERSCRGEIANDDDLPVCKQKQLLSPNVKFDLKSTKTRIPIGSDGNSASAAARYPWRPCHPKTSPGSPEQQRLQIWFRQRIRLQHQNEQPWNGEEQIDPSQLCQGDRPGQDWPGKGTKSRIMVSVMAGMLRQQCRSTLSTVLAGQAYSLKNRIKEAEVTVGKWCSTWCR